MKDWSDNHPKAKVMARKRDVIVAAASKAFLTDGYSGASMERIAASAGVSIMTLYRHARNKDDLFSAVIAKACHPAHHSEASRIEAALTQPLREILVFVGVMFQDRVTGGMTVALLRTVIVEAARFPHLAERAYDGLIGSHLETLDGFLAERPELAAIDAQSRNRLASAFLDRLIATDIFRVLLGLSGLSPEERQDRAEKAADEFIAAIGQ